MQKTIIYLRASTDKQDFDQQKRTIDKYCAQNNIEPDMTFTEKESGSTSFEDRVLLDALNIAKKGDMIICSESSRITRAGFYELSDITKICSQKGFTIYCIKENLTYGSNNSSDINAETMQLLNMVFTSQQSKAEKSNLSARVKSGMAVCNDKLKKDGFFIAKKNGRMVTCWGDPDPVRKQATLQKWNNASAEARKDKKIKNKDFQKSFHYALLLSQKGLSVSKIAEELNNAGYRAPKGGLFVQQHINRLLNDGKKLLLVDKK